MLSVREGRVYESDGPMERTTNKYDDNGEVPQGTVGRASGERGWDAQKQKTQNDIKMNSWINSRIMRTRMSRRRRPQPRWRMRSRRIRLLTPRRRSWLPEGSEDFSGGFRWFCETLLSLFCIIYSSVHDRRCLMVHQWRPPGLGQGPWAEHF